MISSNQLAKLTEIANNINFSNVGRNFPPVYREFMQLWSSFNHIYATHYPNSGDKEAVKKFGIDPEFAFLHIPVLSLDATKNLATQGCVGDGRKEYEPQTDIRIAFATLRQHFVYDTSKICSDNEKCKQRKAKGVELCNEVALLPNIIPLNNLDNAKFYPFSAMLLIVYQMRNNLFHGSKDEIFGDDLKRNEILVTCSQEIIENILITFMNKFVSP